MVECGFAAVANPNDPIVEMIVESNIGGIVGRVKGLAVPIRRVPAMCLPSE